MIDAGAMVLLLGGSGLVGSAIARIFAEAGYRIDAPSHQEFDLNELDKIVPGVEARSPELIINCAAMLGHENCEEHPEAALHLNALAPKQLAIAAEKLAIPMVQISTSAVFDGRKPTPYVESDQPSPVNMYGGSKYLGECFVRAYCSQAYIVRLPMVFGASPKPNASFIEKMLRELHSADTTVYASNDEVCSPVFNMQVARTVLNILREDEKGIFHVAGCDPVVIYGLVVTLSRLFNVKKNIVSVAHDFFGRKCALPLQGSLLTLYAKNKYENDKFESDVLAIFSRVKGV